MKSRRILLTLLLAILPLAAKAAALATQEPSVIRAGVTVEEPFDLKKEGVFQGFCIDLWQAIAGDLGLKYRYVEYPSFHELLEATRRGEVDVNVNSLYVTSERIREMDFLLPFLQGGMQVMVNERRTVSLARLWNGLRDSGHLMIFTIGIAVILCATILLTLAERRWNSEFHQDWANGLAESFYHVMSITMTGKSTHRELPGPWGKVLAGIWIAFGVAVVAYITSSVTSVMTVNKLHGVIQGPKDLQGHRVGVIKGSVAENYCRDSNLECETFPTLPEAVKALVSENIQAVVGDAISLQWYDNSHPELPITEVGPIFLKKYCAFALPQGSSLRRDLNMALLKRHESGYIEELRKHYFGDID